MTKFPLFRALALSLVIVGLSACGGAPEKRSRIDYKKVVTLPPLEVPPDLEVPQNRSSEDIPQIDDAAQRRFAVLPLGEKVSIGRHGEMRWLKVAMPPEELWPLLRSFWLDFGMELKVDEPRYGVMETVWAENRADTPNGLIARMMKGVFPNIYSSETKDKYRLRLEHGANGESELYITHYGLIEIIASQTDEIVETSWQRRPSDPELANEVLNRLLVFLGNSEEASRQAIAEAPDQPRQASLEGDTLVIFEGFDRGWRRTGIALDRLGLVIEDRDRSAGIYYVSHVNQLLDAGIDQSGWFDDDEEAKAQRYRVMVVSPGEERTRVRIINEDGSPLPAEQGAAFLKSLEEMLR